MGGSPNDTPPSPGARLSMAAKPTQHSASKKEKKRKASSQKPPVITPSDASEDDKESPKTVTVANSISHRPKRLAPDPCSQPHGLLAVKNQAIKKSLAHGPKTNKQHREDTGISQPQSTLTDFQPNEFVSPPKGKGGPGAGFPLNDRKHDEARVLNVSTQPIRSDSSFKRLRKIKSVRDPQTRATKRLRPRSMSGEPEEGSKSIHELWARDPQEPTIQGPLSTGPPLTRGKIHVESTVRGKRTRLEFETGFVASHEKPSADCHEVLGPDIRSSPKRFPKKVGDGRRRLVPVVDEDTAVRGVPCGTSSLEHTDHLLRDAASKAQAVLQEEVGPDVQDWTQYEGHDAECDDLSGHDQDEANGIEVTSAPSMVTPKPPVPAPPRIWAQVSCFIASLI